MRFATGLYRRFAHLVHEMAKFGTVGAVAYAVQLATTNLLWSALDAPALAGQAAGTVCATLVAFLGNRYWTFGHRARTGLGREYVLFFIMNGIGLLIQLGCLWAAVHGLGLDGPLARNIAGNVLGVGVGSLFRFWSYRTWVFPERRDAPEEPGSQQRQGA